MDRQIKVSFIYKDAMQFFPITLTGEPSAAMLVGAALVGSGLLKEGESVDAANFVIFDMASCAEIHVNSVSMAMITHVGFYPKGQSFMPDATPELMGKAFRFAAASAAKFQGT